MLFQDIPEPRKVGLPHDIWRRAQLDAFLKIRTMHNTTGGNFVVEAPVGCHAKGQPILMFDGTTKNVEDIVSGDCLMGMDGTRRIVFSTIKGYGKLYKVIPMKGDSFIVNEDHILTLVRTNISKHGSVIRKDCLDGNIIDIKLSDYIKSSNNFKRNHKLFRVSASFSEKNLPIDPYFLGIILGDGSITRGISITTSDLEIISEVNNQSNVWNVGIRIEEKKNKINKAKTYHLTNGRNGGEETLLIKSLKNINLFGCDSESKFIPHIYKTSTPEHRNMLLAGLLDTDGSLSSGTYDYISKSIKLANDIAFVARSLGYSAYIKESYKYCQTGNDNNYYRVSISGDISNIPCRIAHKKAPERKQKKSVLRTGFSTEYLYEDNYYGFNIDGDGRYLLGDFTVTHNTGKSGIATALGAIDKTLVIVSNHGLLEQYERIYGFDIIKGKQEYPCVLESKVNSWQRKYKLVPTASDCHFEEMYECPVSFKCPYLLAKKKAMDSNRAACTYKYAALSQPFQEREGIVVMDEAHNVVEDLLGTSAFEMSDSTRKEYQFDAFPLINYGTNGKGDLLNKDAKTKVLIWLQSCMNEVAVYDMFDFASPKNAKNKKMFERIKEAMMFVLKTEDIFYVCNYNNDDDWRRYKSKNRSDIRMSMKSISVEPIASRILEKKSTKVFMSATIGKPDPLMEQVGVMQFEFAGYPHPVPVYLRPIYDLGVDRMTKSNIDSRPSLYKDQASKIAKFIRTLDPTWRGIVLTSSNYKVNLLRRFLEEELDGRIFVQEEGRGLGDRVSEFIRDTTPGMISVDTIQGWGSGISLDGDIARFSIVAGVPFANPADRFEAIRMETEVGRKYGWWKPFSDVAQATGRVTRGERDETGEYLLNVAGLADGSATSNLAKAQYPVWMKNAITKIDL